jgi:hypothetical protein
MQCADLFSKAAMQNANSQEYQNAGSVEKSEDSAAPLRNCRWHILCIWKTAEGEK